MDSSPTRVKVAVIFHRLGPYHWARLEAAAAPLEVLAIEAFSEEAIYPWERVTGASSFELVTLCSGPISQFTRREFRRRISDQLDRFAPQAVFVPGWGAPEAFAALAWCVQRRVPAIVMSESTASDEKRSAGKEWIKRRLIALFSSGLVGGSPHADYLAQLGMPHDRIFCGYDAVDNAYFYGRAKELRAQGAFSRSERGQPENYFLASARFVEKKNLPRLLEAYALYVERCRAEKAAPPWSLVLLGDGPLRKNLEAQIAALQLQDQVLLPGFIQYGDLPAYYAWAGVFVHASTVEQWGLVVNEAMASGLPILVSDRCGCAPDLVQEGQNGFTFDPQDVETLALLLQQMAGSQAAARQEMARASERIIAEWCPARFAAGAEEAVRKALETGPPPARWIDRLVLRGLLLR